MFRGDHPPHHTVADEPHGYLETGLTHWALDFDMNNIVSPLDACEFASRLREAGALPNDDVILFNQAYLDIMQTHTPCP